MKDFLGNDINIGDTIVFPKQNILDKSVVTKIENNIIWFKYNESLEVGYNAEDIIVIKKQ